MNNNQFLDGYGTTNVNLEEVVKYGEEIYTYPTDYGTNYTKDEERLNKQGRNDVLYNLSNDDKYKFYERISLITKINDSESLAALLLGNWLYGIGNTVNNPFIVPNDRIKGFNTVEKQMELHKKIYLSETSFKKKIVGVKPRLKSGEWDGVSELNMKLDGSTFTIYNIAKALALRKKIRLLTLFDKQADIDDIISLDLFASLNETSLRSKVVIDGERISERKVKVKVREIRFWIWDNYNWDAGESLKVINPDYKNSFNVENPVSPTSPMVEVYHNHALKLENEERAKSFFFESERWTAFQNFEKEIEY